MPFMPLCEDFDTVTSLLEDDVEVEEGLRVRLMEEVVRIELVDEALDEVKTLDEDKEGGAVEEDEDNFGLINSFIGSYTSVGSTCT